MKVVGKHSLLSNDCLVWVLPCLSCFIEILQIYLLTRHCRKAQVLLVTMTLLKLGDLVGDTNESFPCQISFHKGQRYLLLLLLLLL